jgi:hypothetical protein
VGVERGDGRFGVGSFTAAGHGEMIRTSRTMT